MFSADISFKFLPSCIKFNDLFRSNYLPGGIILEIPKSLNKELPWLWQRPADSFYPDDETWFQKSPLGKTTISSMMSKISRKGELSRRYTNHSIRSTAITVLDEAGVFKFFILNFYF